MVERISNLQLPNLSDEALNSIKDRAASQRTQKRFGEDYKFWLETFQLCKDVPILIAEIERLKTVIVNFETKDVRNWYETYD